MTASPADTDRGLAAVLFDMDGTLLDSEKLWDVALADLAGWLGGELSDRARARMIGTSLAQSVAILHDDLGVEADPESSSTYLVTAVAELYRTTIIWRPGARELVAAVRAAGVPAALVTATNRRLTEIALDGLGRDNFTVTVCGDEVHHAKPHPDPYLSAARLLGVPPSRCVAIEDSPTGTASAEAAGCAVISVPNDVPIAPAPTRTVLDSLVGLDLGELERLVRAHQARLDPTAEP